MGEPQITVLFYRDRTFLLFSGRKRPCPYAENSVARISGSPRSGFTIAAYSTYLVDDPHDLHPSYKWEIGRRHALKALKYTYHSNIVADGPELAAVKYQGKLARVKLKHAKGLKAIDGNPLTSFEVAGEDGIFYPAKATINGHTVVLESDQVQKVLQVRFGWDEAAQPNLVNAADLPAAPFRTNNPLQHIKLK